ncbi:MAG: DUF4276 family protein [Treponema sp.]|jgi:hypothetical protein|nr:DUF4276 family protein [Treponema sp.]
MTILICCEGKRDIGPITSFIKKCAHPVTVQVKCETHKSIKRIRKYQSLGRDNSRINMISKLKILALIEESSHLGYHQDSDDQNFLSVYNSIKRDFQNIVSTGMKYLPVVPKKTMESWLLSDNSAYPSIPKNPPLPEKPEELWSVRGDSQSNHPKQYFKRVLKQFNRDDTSNSYTQIAEASNIEVIRNRCPESFGQFYADMQSFIAAKTGAP